MRNTHTTRRWPQAVVSLCSALALLGLSGCGSGDGQQAEAQTQTAAAAPATQATDQGAFRPLLKPAEAYGPTLRELKLCPSGVESAPCGPQVAINNPDASGAAPSRDHTQCMKRSRDNGLNLEQATQRCATLL